MTIRIGSDGAEKKVLSDVAEYGWHCLNILEEDGYAPFSFSIGLYETWKFPELIIVGLKREVAHGVLNIVATALKEGNRPDLGATNQDLLEGYACCFVEVSKSYYRDYVGTARWYYGGDSFPLYQIVWPSKQGHFPWHSDASESFVRWQPVLGEGASTSNPSLERTRER
jgi:Domain of unknown function (DUF4262)